MTFDSPFRLPRPTLLNKIFGAETPIEIHVDEYVPVRGLAKKITRLQDSLWHDGLGCPAAIVVGVKAWVLLLNELGELQRLSSSPYQFRGIPIYCSPHMGDMTAVALPSVDASRLDFEWSKYASDLASDLEEHQ